MQLVWTAYLTKNQPSAEDIEAAINSSLKWIGSYTDKLPNSVSVKIGCDDEAAGIAMDIEWVIEPTKTAE